MIERPYAFGGTTVIIGLLGAVVLACAGGLWAGGRMRRAGIDRQRRPELATIVAAVLGPFGLLLGFSLSVAISRHDARKIATVNEANAIGTAFARASLVPAVTDPVRALLREYVDLDVAFYLSIGEAQRSQLVERDLVSIQDRLWRYGAGALSADPRSVAASDFVQSINGLVDRHAVRIAMIRNYLPPILLLLLAAFAVVGSALTGYAAGLTAHGDRFTPFLASLMSAAVLLVVVDIDRPLYGFITVGQESMQDLRDYMQTH